VYSPVPKIPNFPELEHRWLRYWSEIDAFGQVVAKNAGNAKWSFLDGPITANNPMGVHHAWGRSYKDMFQRYHAMNGKELRYQNGFDCQGLWVEVEVEKELGFETKADIATFGIEHFVRACKERVLTYAARQTEQSVRLGYWTGWDNTDTLLRLRDALHNGDTEVTVTAASGRQTTGSPERLIGELGSAENGGSYFTFSTENNYTIWKFLKKCHDEGFVYRGTDVMPWCCRCGTGLSQMEVAEGRKITKHTSVFVRFPLVDREKTALLVWTTTPWTLTSNVAAAVNPDMTYLEVRHGEWTYFLGKGNFKNDRIQKLEAAGQKETHKLHTLQNILKGSGALEVVRELPGSELVGLQYHGPFDHLAAQQTTGGQSPYPATAGLDKTAIECHRVIAWDIVSEKEGTGIVHVAPGCGAEDSRLGKEEDIVAIAPLAEDGTYTEGFGELSGRSVHSVTDDIVADLKARDILVAKESYPHVYPHCWRCKEELVFRLVDEWFIRMDWRDRIQKLVPDIRWIPPDGQARELDWLKNMGDWMISKKRFWGLALPIWRCTACEWFDVIGGKDELEERATAGWSEFDGHTPHRPYVDAVHIQCGDCGAEAHRVLDVGNPWLDAGIVPFSTMHWSTDPDYWREWFPADFVVECFPGQFRNWFYALLSMSAMMSESAPFKVLLGHALVRDARGEEMHKSSGNSIVFDQAADTLGAEVMRYLYAGQNPTQNLNFPDLPEPGAARVKGGIDGEIRKKLLTWWNCYSFFVTYARVDGWKPGDHAVIPVDERHELDRWVLSRLQDLIAGAHKAFGDFTLYRFIHRFEQFSDAFSNWYLRRSRRRFWRAESDLDKESAYQTMYEVLTTLTRLMAPILPFLAEEMYENLVRSVNPDAPATVHLQDFPAVDPTRVDGALETQIDCVIRTKNLGLSLRNAARLKIRQPLGELLVRAANDAERAVLADTHFAEQVLEECNVKALKLIEDEGELAKTIIKPNFKALGPRYGKYMKEIAAHIGSADADALAAGGYAFAAADGTQIAFEGGDLLIAHEGPDHLVFGSADGAFAALDTRITPALEAEGIARDFNRLAQDQRKALDLDVSDRITVRFAASDRIAAALDAHTSMLCEELLAESIERVETIDEAMTGKTGGESVSLVIARA
jgi:isoleucyl-tRNA synthetase